MHLRKRTQLVLGLLGMVLAVAACGGKDDDSDPTMTPPDSGIDSAVDIAAMSPAALTESFYRWHLSFPGNPLVHPRDKWHDYLTDEWIQAVEETLASFDPRGGGGDPFLCAQDFPNKVAVEEVSRSETDAVVAARFAWVPGTSQHEVTVELVRADDQWKINRIICPRLPSSP